MYPTIIGIIALILSVTIALLALSIGGYHSMLRVLLYLRFPPARFYFNAMQAVERLENLNDKPSIPASEQIQQGIVGATDVGFRELTKILQENRMISGEVEEIILGEIPLGEGGFTGLRIGEIPITPEQVRFLGVIQNGKQITLQREQFDPSRITRNLTNLAEEITRKYVAKWIILFLLLYLIAGIYLVLAT